MSDRFWFGADYNPEQWPEPVWEEDVELMKRAGVNLVSLGIFSWAEVEPSPGEYRFDWLDRVMDLLSANGIGVCLATMTASPPPWLARLHPESLPRTEEGTILWPGSRQHYCPSNHAYRDHSARLVEAVASRYAGHPALALWHCQQRIRAPQLAVLLRHLGPGVPGLADRALRHHRRAQQGLVHHVLVPALWRIRRGVPAPRHAYLRQSRAGARLPPVLLRRTARMFLAGEGNHPPDHPRSPGDHEFRRRLAAHRQFGLGAAPGHHRLRLLPGST